MVTQSVVPLQTLTDLIPMEPLFVFIFGFLPVIISIYDKGIENVSAKEWLSFALIAGGAVLVWVVSSMRTSVQMQTYLWPLLGVMAAGFLLYRVTLVERGEWDESTIERGGTSYED